MENARAERCHIFLTTYDTVRLDAALLTSRSFNLIVFDEIQRVKNRSSATSQAVRRLSASRRWGLTGTPLENRVEEFATILETVRAPAFIQREVTGAVSPEELRDHARAYVLRRRKEDALPELPGKVVGTKWLELTREQRTAYDRAEGVAVRELRSTRNVTLGHVLARIQKLKQLCNFDPETGASAKLDFLKQEYLDQACRDEQKALIFSQYVGPLKRLASELHEYGPLLYVGGLSAARRHAAEQAFAVDPVRRVLLVSLRAGGLGLNLTAANSVLHFDRWWNPAVEHQAEDRVHRIGQPRTVFVTRLICADTIEERIEHLLQRKQRLFREAVDALTDVRLERVLSKEELFGLFGLTPPGRNGANSVAGTTASTRRAR